MSGIDKGDLDIGGQLQALVISSRATKILKCIEGIEGGLQRFNGIRRFATAPRPSIQVTRFLFL